MAAALSLHGEINNALNPQPRTPRGRALVETVIGGGLESPHCASRAGRLDRKLWMGWVPKPLQAGGAVTERQAGTPRTQPSPQLLPAEVPPYWCLQRLNPLPQHQLPCTQIMCLCVCVCAQGWKLSSTSSFCTGRGATTSEKQC